MVTCMCITYSIKRMISMYLFKVSMDIKINIIQVNTTKMN